MSEDRATLVERLRKEAHDLDAAYRVPADGPSPTSALLLEAADALATAPPGREAVPSVPNPCSVCGVPIFGSFIGTGDGTMRAGGSFAHPDCYWRQRAEAAEAEAEREAVRVLETLQSDMRDWTHSSESYWAKGYNDAIQRVRQLIDARLAALRAEGEGGDDDAQ